MLVAQVLMFGLARYFPIVTKLPTKTLLAVKKSMAVMQGEGRKMLEIRRKQAEAGELDDKIDLLSLIVKANLKESKKDMITDEELMGQITTFMLAGHETTAGVCLPPVWSELRTESAETPTLLPICNSRTLVDAAVP